MIICYLNKLQELLDSTLYCTIQCSFDISNMLHAWFLFGCYKKFVDIYACRIMHILLLVIKSVNNII